MRFSRWLVFVFLLPLFVACGSSEISGPEDAGSLGGKDGGSPTADGGPGKDGGVVDGGTGRTDGGRSDGGPADGGSAVLVFVRVQPPNPTIARGTTLPLRATGFYSDGSTADLTSRAVWTSSDPAVATFDSAGVVRGVGPGMASVTARLGTIAGTTTVHVTGANLVGLEIQPATVRLAVGASQPFTVTAIFDDMTRQDVTPTAVLASSSPQVANFGQTDATRSTLSALSAGVTTVTASFGGRMATATVTVSAATLVSIAVTPANPTLPVGILQPFEATGTYDDGSVQSLTRDATWSSTAPDVATVSDDPATRGQVRTVSAGTTQIAARVGDVIGSTVLAVTAAALQRIELMPSTAAIPVGTGVQIRATGVYADGSSIDITESATWSSSAPDIADVSNVAGTHGLVSGLSPGAARIRAALGGIEAFADVTVSPAMLTGIEIMPLMATIPVGLTQSFTANGVYDNGTRVDITAQVLWSSEGTSIATVSNAAGSQGVVTAVAQGSTKIQAAMRGFTAEATVNVTAAALSGITVAPAQSTLYVGWRVPFKATAAYSDGTTADVTATAVWTSSDESVATVSNATLSHGYVTGIGTGSATITAAYGGMSGTAQVTVQSATLSSLSISPVLPTVPVGATLQFTATAILSDNTTRNVTAQATWSSATPSVATLGSGRGQTGVARAVAAGTTVIQASYMGLTAQTTLTVTDAVLMSIQISPVNPTLPVGGRILFQATGIYSDNTTRPLGQATWTSSNTQVADVQTGGPGRGTATALSPGMTTITAAVGGISGSTVLSVTDAVLMSITVSPINPSVAAGTTFRFSATGIYTDNTSRDVTGAAAWTSSNTSVAQVTDGFGNKGVTTALSAGTAVITAAVGGISGTSTLTVTAATLTAIEVTPIDPNVAVGTQLQFAATALFSDNTSQPVGPGATWQSSDLQVAQVQTGGPGGAPGLATSLAAGTTTISATFRGVTGSTTLTVRAAQLVSVSVSPIAPSVPLGARPQFTATAIYDDGTSQPATGIATWTSSNTAVAQISNDPRTRGQATTISVGTTTISATVNGVAGSTTLTVTDAVPTAIQVTPFFPSTPLGTDVQFQATIILSDNTTANVTANATWSSSDPTVAQVGNGPGDRGRATPLSVGTTTISATLAGITGMTTLTVTGATLTRIEVTPFTARIPVGLYVLYRATGIYSDQTTRDLTELATWSSTMATIADVSNATGGRGTARGLAAGMTTIGAVYGGITGSASLTVTAAALTSVEVAPATADAAVGNSVAFTATAHYDDGTTYPVTAFALWDSSDTTVALVSNATGSKGEAFTFAAGMSTIGATFGGMEGSATLTVHSP
jgi:hypothetical protein